MKKAFITALLLLSANLVLANEFLNKVERPQNVNKSDAEIAVQEELNAALSINAELL